MSYKLVDPYGAHGSANPYKLNPKVFFYLFSKFVMKKIVTVHVISKIGTQPNDSS